MGTDMTLRSITALAVLAAVIGALAAAGTEHNDDDEKAIAALARDPQQLEAALRACRARIAPADDAECKTASEAWRRHFFEKGNASDPSTLSASVLQGETLDAPVATEPTPWVYGP
jgi:conjugative transfer region protein TrbK